MTAGLGWTAAALAGVGAFQIVPAATWLPPVRARLTPNLNSPMPSGEVAMTFDDGPHPDGTVAVLDELDRHGWRATFFVLGSQASLFPEIVTEIAGRGHAVGVHGHDHRYLIGRSPKAAADDLWRATDVVANITRQAVKWWRPPYGVLSGPSLLAARRVKLTPVLWSAWGRDWEADATPESIAAQVRRGRLDGGTVLLHDSDVTSAAGSWRGTVGSLPLIAADIAAAGLRVAPLPGQLV